MRLVITVQVPQEKACALTHCQWCSYTLFSRATPLRPYYRVPYFYMYTVRFTITVHFSLSVLQYNLESSPNGQTRSSSSGGGAAGASKGAYSVRTEEEGCYCTRDGFLSCPGSTRFLTAETRSSRARRAMKPTGSSRVHVAVF